MYKKQYYTDYYGKQRAIATTESHIIYDFLGRWYFTSKDNYNAQIQDARKCMKFDFDNIDDCIEYANEYL